MAIPKTQLSDKQRITFFSKIDDDLETDNADSIRAAAVIGKLRKKEEPITTEIIKQTALFNVSGGDAEIKKVEDYLIDKYMESSGVDTVAFTPKPKGERTL